MKTMPTLRVVPALLIISIALPFPASAANPPRAAVAAGSSHTLFTTADGKLWAMGYNYSGQLGTGDTTDRTTPVESYINSYVVTFNPGADATLHAQPSEKTIIYVSSPIAYGALPVPGRAGYYFAGWFTGAGGAGTRVTEATAVIAANHTLYAHWVSEIPDGADSMYLIYMLDWTTSDGKFPARIGPDAPDLSNDTCRTTELWLRRIEAGEYMMGSPNPEAGRDATNEIRHRVTLSSPFYAAVFETTQAQYKYVTGTNPSLYYQNGDPTPVEGVTYVDLRGASAGAGWPNNNTVDANSFFGKLRAKTGLQFDLPTEAQWEYACRANPNASYALNNNDLSDINQVARYYWNRSDNKPSSLYNGRHTCVGSYEPNDWGLYDMHGNVWEWTLDWYQPNLGELAATDPKGPSSATVGRVMRGGSWYDEARFCRSAARAYAAPGAYNAVNDGDSGFRIFLTLTASPLAPGGDLLPQTNVAAGSAVVTLSVTPASGAGALYYQWQKYDAGTGGWISMAGKTTNTLLLSGLTTSNNGDRYRVQITAVAGGSQTISYSNETILAGITVGGGGTGAPVLNVSNIILSFAQPADSAATFTATGNIAWSAGAAQIGAGDCGWLAVTPGAGGASTTTPLTAYAVSANTTGAARTAKIQIAGAGAYDNIIRDVIVTQRASAAAGAAPPALAAGATLVFNVPYNSATGGGAHTETYTVAAGDRLIPSGAADVSYEYACHGDTATLIFDDAVWTLDFTSATKTFHLYDTTAAGAAYELNGAFTHTPPAAGAVTIIFAPNGGSVTTTSKTVTTGGTYGALPVPARAGHAFDGWFTAGSGGTRIETTTTVTTSAATQTLYAHWTASGTGGESGGGSGGGGGGGGAPPVPALAALAALLAARAWRDARTWRGKRAWRGKRGA